MADNYEVDIGVRYADLDDWAKINQALSPWEARRWSAGSSLGEDRTRDQQFLFESAEMARDAKADMTAALRLAGFEIAYCHVHGPGREEL